jgi:hypothetical protein
LGNHYRNSLGDLVNNLAYKLQLSLGLRDRLLR